jgi:hypothetical protein
MSAGLICRAIPKITIAVSCLSLVACGSTTTMSSEDEPGSSAPLSNSTVDTEPSTTSVETSTSTSGVEDTSSSEISSPTSASVVASTDEPSQVTLDLDDPDRFVITENYFEAQADAPFPASMFVARNSRAIVTAERVYVVTAGRSGVGAGDAPAVGTFFVESMPAGTAEIDFTEFVSVESCPSPVALEPGDVSDPSAVPFICEATGERGHVDLVGLTVELSTN